MSERINQIIKATAILLAVITGGLIYRSVETEKLKEGQKQNLSNAIQELSNVKPELQSIYIISLGGYGTSSIPVLLKLLSLPPESPIAAGAGVALQLTGEEGYKELIRIAENTSLPIDTRKAALAGLGKMGGKNTSSILLEILNNSSETAVIRAEAARSIINFSGIDLIEPVLKIMSGEEHKPGDFYQGLIDLNYDLLNRVSSISKPKLPSGTRSYLISGLKDKKADVRFFAVKYCVQFDIEDCVNEIQTISANDSVDYVKEAASQALQTYTERKKK